MSAPATWTRDKRVSMPSYSLEDEDAYEGTNKTIVVEMRDAHLRVLG